MLETPRSGPLGCARVQRQMTAFPLQGRAFWLGSKISVGRTLAEGPDCKSRESCIGEPPWKEIESEIWNECKNVYHVDLETVNICIIKWHI